MKKRSLVLTALVVPVLAILSACGGSSQSTLDKVKADGVITFGTEGTYPPFTYHDAKTQKLVGYDVEVATAVAKKMGVEAKFAETTFDSIFAGLTSKRFDAVANQVTENPERAKLYSLSDPYTVSEGVIVVKADNTKVKSDADLKGLTTAQSATTTFAKTAKEAGAKLEAVEGFSQAITLVKQGRVDATINDNLAVLQYLKTTNDTDVKIVAKTGDVAKQVFAARKDDKTLTTAFNKALADLQADGTLARISEKYFGKDVSR
jgi:ABC-type amino acid transport substrate-binding protein